MTHPFSLEITDMLYTGYALGKHDGKAIFVPYALPGETITARITRDKDRFAFAHVERIDMPAPERVDPRCAHFGAGECGGCQWQHADYAAQLVHKEKIVREQFARIGGLRDVLVHPTIPSADPWAYRSHVTLHITPNGEPGFMSDSDGARALAIRECHIMRPEVLALFEQIKPFRWRGVDTIRLQVGDDGARAIGITRKDPRAKIDVPDVDASIVLTDSDRTKPLRGSGVVRYHVHNRTFAVTVGGFFQVNSSGAHTLVDLVNDRLGDMGEIHHALDLYAGVGLFSAFMANRATRVTAIESYAPAVRDAKINHMDRANITLVAATIEDALPLMVKRGDHADAAVVDPPRAGMKEAALDALAAMHPRRVVYVSCDPTTLARDAKRLIAHGYTLIDVQPIDMFPQTYHIESVAVFDL